MIGRPTPVVLHSPALLALGLVVIGIVGLLVPRMLSRFRNWLFIARGLRAQSRGQRADLSRAADYHEALPAAERSDALDEDTWRDLDLNEVFASLDRTESQLGRQFLYHLLRTPKASVAPLARLERAVQRLARDDSTAAPVRAALRQLADPRAAYVVTLLFGELPRRPRFWWLFPLLTTTSLICLAFVAFWPRAAVIWLAVCAVNICAQLYYKPRVRSFIPAYHEIPAFLRVARLLGAMQMDEIAEELAALRSGEQQLGLLRRATSWLLFEPGQTNELVATLYEYMNLLFLFDVNAFVFGTHAARGSRDVLRRMFDAIGYIDAAQSIAAWRHSMASWTAPVLTDPRKELHATGLFHPLLPNPVPNSLEISGTSVLITGSNMAGKSTFVRTLGVNAVLAQALHTVCAAAWRAPLMHVHSSIGRSDSLVQGKSHYFAEIESVLRLIRAKEDGRQHLILLDELFQGTNTTERVAAGYAVLSYLNRGLDIVVLATHDVELLDLLGNTYAAHHFREHVAEDTIAFDFLVRPGPSSTRNAIAMLRLVNYPEALVADALSVIDWQGARGNRHG